MSLLKNISLDYLINNEEVEKLLFLYNSNKLIDKQKNKVVSMFLTNIRFVKSAVEKYPEELNKFKYKNDVLTLYDLVINENIFKKDVNMKNFNKNDSAFIWFILYKLLFVSPFRDYQDNVYNVYNDINYELIKHEPYIRNYFGRRTDYVNKIVGIIRVNEFGLDINEYLELWGFSEYYGINTFSYDDGEYLFRVKGYSIDISFTYDYKFSFFSERGKILHTRINFELFGYNNKFYVKEKTISKKVSNVRELDIDKINKEKPFIESASKYLIEIVPFIEGKVEYVMSHSGKIVDGRYVMTIIHDDELDKINISPLVIYDIYDNYGL